MKRFIYSTTYQRWRLANAAIFVLLGATILGRTVMGAGLAYPALPAYVLGAALLGLGIFRIRDWLRVRGR